jgi:hypothetical protein
MALIALLEHVSAERVARPLAKLARLDPNVRHRLAPIRCAQSHPSVEYAVSKFSSTFTSTLMTRGTDRSADCRISSTCSDGTCDQNPDGLTCCMHLLNFYTLALGTDCYSGFCSSGKCGRAANGAACSRSRLCNPCCPAEPRCRV